MSAGIGGGRARRLRVERSPAWIYLVILGLSSCAPHQVRRDPPPPVQLLAEYQQRAKEEPSPAPTPATAAESQQAQGRRWWRDFDDPALSALIDQALTGSFDMQAAWARLSQADAAADIAGAPRWPALTAGLGANYQRINIAAFRPGGGGLDNYGASGSLQASYEIDVWAKISSNQKAATLDSAAAADQLRTLAISLSAEVADAYYDVLAARARRKLLQSQQELSASVLTLVEYRFGQGLATAVEVNQQRQQVLSANAALEQLVAQEAVQHHRLSTLLGRRPDQTAPPPGETLPELPSLPPTGVPTDLLKRRPDLRAAQRQVEAADYRVAAAVADRFPSLRLTGSVSTEPSKLNDWLLSPLWSLAANLALPLIDGGQRRAEVARREALMAEAVANYGKAVLGALVEVENALIQERQQQRQIERVREQLEVARTTFQQAQTRYGQGASDFLSVLTALRSQQDVERLLLDAQRQLLSYRIQLCRALGGTWTDELHPGAAAGEKEAS